MIGLGLALTPGQFPFGSGGGAPAMRIELTAANVSSTNGANVASNTFDGNLTTYWKSNTADNGWIGVDCGTDAIPVRLVYVQGGEGDTEPGWLLGATLQGSDASDFSGAVDYGAIPVLAPVRRQWLFDCLLPEADTAHRYWRIKPPAAGTYGGVPAELRWEVEYAAPGATAGRPLRPVIAPWGGGGNTTNRTVTLTCGTSGAAIYYTVDGSTPTTGSTLYSGPFVLDTTTDTVVKAIASLGSLTTPLSEISSATFVSYGFGEAYVRRTKRGNLLNVGGGSILNNTSRDGYYYWVGANLIMAGVRDAEPMRFINLIRSTDLHEWEDCGGILDDDDASNVGMLRPHILYNASTSKYVLWAHKCVDLGSNDKAAIATSDFPDRGWAWVDTEFQPIPGVGYKDCNLFQEEDGTAYTVFSDNVNLYIAQLDSDYLGSGTYITVANADGREAPVLAKINGIYWLIGSIANYYDSDSTYDQTYQSCATVMGTWSARRDLFAVDPVGSPFNGQSSFFLNVGGTLLYGSDQWFSDDLSQTKHVWLKLRQITAEDIEAAAENWTLAGTPPGGVQTPARIASTIKTGALTTDAIDTTGANCVVVAIAYYGLEEITGVTDSKGNTYVPRPPLARGTDALQYWVATGATVGSGHTVTIAVSGLAYQTITVAAYSNIEASPIDSQFGNSTAGATTIAPGSLTPRLNKSLVVLACNHQAASFTVGGGFSIAQQIAFNSGVSYGAGISDLVQTTATASNPTTTFNVSTVAICSQLVLRSST